MKIQPLSIVAVEGEGRVERWSSPVRRRLLSSWNSFQLFFGKEWGETRSSWKKRKMRRLPSRAPWLKVRAGMPCLEWKCWRKKEAVKHEQRLERR